MEERKKKLSGQDKVLLYMKSRGSITPMEALRYCGVYRLSNCIMRLRKDYIITTRMGERREDGREETCTYIFHGKKKGGEET